MTKQYHEAYAQGREHFDAVASWNPYDSEIEKKAWLAGRAAGMRRLAETLARERDQVSYPKARRHR